MLHNLVAKKKTLTDKMRILWDIRDQGKKWDETQEQEYSRMSDECDKLTKEIEQRSLFLKQTSEDQPKAEKTFQRDGASISLGTIARALLFRRTNNSVYREDLGKLREFSRETELKNGKPRDDSPDSMTIPEQAFERVLGTSDTSGGASIQTSVKSPTIGGLFADTFAKKLGCNFVKSDGPEYSQPVVKSQGKSDTKAEGTDLDIEDIDLETAFTLTPHRMGKIVVVESIWLQQSSDPSIVTREMMREFTEYADNQFLNGTGLTAYIRGILNYTGLKTTPGGTNGSALTYKRLVDAKVGIMNENEKMEIGFLINPNVFGKAVTTLKAQASGSEFLYHNGKLCDSKTAITTLLANNQSKGSGRNLSDILCFVPSRVTICSWGSPSLAISESGETWFKKNQIAYRITHWADLGIVYPGKSFNLLKHNITQS